MYGKGFHSFITLIWFQTLPRYPHFLADMRELWVFVGVLHLLLLQACVGRQLDETAGEWFQAVSPNSKPEDDMLFTSLGSSRLFLRSIDLDENHIHSCFEYKLVNVDNVVSVSNTFCMPLVVVAGIRKCSTSALYNLLAQYPGALRIPNKENCVAHYTNILEYFHSLPNHVGKGQIFVDGCIEPPSNVYLNTILKKRWNSFYLLITRDYADWIWSAYNYWCNEEYDGVCKRKTVDVKTCKRSPELLHDIVVAGMKGLEVKTPLQMAVRPCEVGEKRYSRIFNKNWQDYPLENTLILASEELESNPRGVWTTIARAVGLSTVHPHIKEFEQVRYNAQVDSTNTTGFGKTVNASTFQPGLYEVSGYRPMLKTTVDILHKCWTQDCVYTSLVTRHMYAACRADAIKHNAKPGQYLASTISDRVQRDRALKYMDKILAVENNRTDSYRSFISRIKDDACERRFDAMRADVAARMAKETKTGGKAKASTIGNVVVLTTSAEDARYVEQLLYYSTIGTARVVNAFISAAEVPTSELVRDASVDSVCTSAGAAVASSLPVITIAHPGSVSRTIRPLPATGGSDSLSLTHFLALNASLLRGSGTSLANQCLSRIEYGRAVVLSSDLLTNLWSSYLRRYEFDTGLSESMVYRFNWHKWDAEAPEMLRNMTSAAALASNTSSGVYWSAAHLQALVGGGSSPDKKLSSIEPIEDATVLRGTVQADNTVVAKPPAKRDATLVLINREDLIYVENRVSVLRQLIDFISPSLLQSSPAPVDVEDGAATAKPFDQLRCAYTETALSSVSSRYDHMRLSKFSHIAYASEHLVCGLRSFVAEEVAAHSGGHLCAKSPEFALLDTFPVTCEGAETPAERTQECSARYAESSIRPTPVTDARVLLGLPGPDVVNLRLLLEHGTGVLTGAVLSGSKELASVFEGELTCSMTQSIVFLDANEAILTRIQSTVTEPAPVQKNATRLLKSADKTDKEEHVAVPVVLAGDGAAVKKKAAAKKKPPANELMPGFSPPPAGADKMVTRNVITFNVTTRSPKMMRRCNSNGVKAFSGGIVAIRDPLVWLHAATKASGQLSSADPQKALLDLLTSTPPATLFNLPLPLLSLLHNISTIASTDFRIVSTDVLMVPFAVGVNTQPANNFVILRLLAQFLGIPKPFQERLDCLYSFIPNYSAQVAVINEAVAFYSEHKEVVCALNREINKMLTFGGSYVRFRVYRLFVDEKCP